MKIRDYALLGSAVSIALLCGWLAKTAGLLSMGSGIVVILLLSWLHHTFCRVHGLVSLLSITLLLLLALSGLSLEARWGLIQVLAFGIALLRLNRLGRDSRKFQLIQSTTLFNIGRSGHGQVRIKNRYRPLPE